MKQIILIVFATLITYVSFSQIKTVHRLEFDSKDEVEISRYYLFGKQGLIQKTIDENKQKNKKRDIVFTFTKYSPELIAGKQVDIHKQKKQYHNESDTTSHYVYNLGYDRKGNYIIHRIDIRDLSVESLTGEFHKRLRISEFICINDDIYIFGYIHRLPFMLMINFSKKTENIAKLIPSNKLIFNVMTFDYDKEEEEVYLFIRDDINDNIETYLYIYKHGKHINKITINTEGEKNDFFIKSGRASKLSQNEYILTGSYSRIWNNMKSTGIYISKIVDSQNQFTQKINYLDINNFLSHLRDWRQKRIGRKKEQVEKRGKELEYTVIIEPHRIIQQKDSYILIGEAYYPTEREDCRTETTPSGTKTVCRDVFDGYQYTHYFIVSFDSQGNVLWSNSKKLDIKQKPFRITQYITKSLTDKALSIMYNNSDSIYYTAYDTRSGKEISGKEYEISSLNSKDEVKFIYNSTTTHWHDTYFITYGYQRLKNEETKDKRKVYFLNKIQIDTQ
ncbi:MAG: hypothetical protein PF481_06955 [Bacteroidales bacterium]|jgi:hypothetical protein|nr:hypothetical protein [Bacteroidales bacterium]